MINLTLWGNLRAQETLKGRIIDQQSEETLPGAYIFVKNTENETLSNTYSDENGDFQIAKPAISTFILEVSFIGFETLKKTYANFQGNDLGTIVLGQDATQLQEVEVKGQIMTGEVKGDTVSFNANAYKTRSQASAGELIRKMPGVNMRGGTIEVQGETVGRVLVDGEPFFGDDPAMAMQNLPVEVIDKIEFLDQKSDQAKLTGFDDGETIKTINIITKKDRRGGKFGQLFAGYGTDDNYLAGGAIHFFEGAQRLSILGLSNNINQQNFSADDLTGAFGSGNNRGWGRRDSDDLTVRSLPGITKTNAVGTNFTDKFDNGKAKISGNYFFNDSKNTLNRTSSREYILPSDSLQFYNEERLDKNNSQTHRMTFKLEYDISDKHAVIWRPRFSYQKSDAVNSLLARNLYDQSTPISETANLTTSNSDGLRIDNDLTYRYKFNKPGRTISTTIESRYRKNNSESLLISANRNYQNENLDSLIQRTNSTSNSNRFEGEIVYTEPIGENSQLRLEYELRDDSGLSDRDVSKREMESFNFEKDSTLSNEFDNGYRHHEMNLGYQYAGEELRIYSSFVYQIADLNSDRLFPGFENTQRNFKNFIPRVYVTYEPNKQTNIRFGYRTDTDAPSVNQLQDVINNSNPLSISMGNPNLEQEYEHRIFTRIRKINLENSKSFFMYFSGRVRKNYMGTSTFIATQDTLINDEVLLRQGGQLRRPVNLDNAYDARTSISFGFPLGFMKSNLNLDTRFSYSNQPGLINEQLNTNHNLGMGQGLSITSNFGEKLDFNLGTSANYNVVRSTLQSDRNSNYYSQSTRLDLYWNFWKGFFISTNVNNQLYAGLGDEFDQSIWLMNADFGYRFPPSENLELKMTVFDLLNQNTSIERNITDVYIENVRTDVLKQFFMLTLTYNLRAFGGNQPQYD
ncbi:outer membrane beta-barrel protein [Echinicola salinicaeni]|uniref:outer membrane beta-barrel protein n=1 Tax=Echinicola salinicaeni TaxID=2762757 RepID=UPI00293BD506|nr:outer membrane beta-barrel protein [Echinicola salinicaeni]